MPEQLFVNQKPAIFEAFPRRPSRVFVRSPGGVRAPLVTALVGILAFMANRAPAETDVPVGNPSFETVGDSASGAVWFRLPGAGAWTDGAPAAIYDVLDLAQEDIHFPGLDAAPEGTRVLNLGNSIPLSQDLAWPVNPGDTITLRFSVGNSTQEEGGADVIATLLLDAAEVHSETVSQAGEGMFAARSVEWTATTGGLLGIRFGKTDGPAYLDAVSVEVTPVDDGSGLTSVGTRNLTSHSAELLATLTGGSGTVDVCWDDSDQGTELSSWSATRRFTGVGEGTSLAALVTGLTDSTTHWFRFRFEEEGSGGVFWSPARSFKTRGPVGAIRWDAWHGDLSIVGTAVETTLGPEHYHHRLPFYGKKISPTEVQVRATTQAVIDKEIAFAKAAGLDYWAYVTYDENSPLSLARQLHQASANKMDMNFCLIHAGGRVGAGGMAGWQDRIARYLAFFQQPNYQTVLDGRPLFYCLDPQNMIGPGKFADWTEAAAAIAQLRTAVTDAGLPTPYLVSMAWSAADAKIYMDQLGFDAVSQYAINGGHSEAPYSTLAAVAENWWTNAADTGAQVIPPLTAGWDRRPRVENPVPWESDQQPGVGIDLYYERPTPAQLSAHLQAARNWCAAHPEATETDALLMYAWNEIDEGGWIVPDLQTRTVYLEAIREVLTPISDDDGDSMSDLWEIWHFDSATSASATSDHDHDGSADAYEFAADTDPRDRNSKLAILGIDFPDGAPRVSWKGGVEARQVLEAKRDLGSTTESWAPVHTVEPPAPVTNEFEESGVTDPAHFYRLRAERP
jgi:hypothetical protein